MYVDDISFDFTNILMCIEFSESISKQFKMSMMISELNFFLGPHKENGIHLSQSKY